ncbi:MAG TPA: glutamine synthetase family protein [Tepidisphaeraceae bacterium]|nr:glutamine synthetase family protein [Tepidisphaeraceae bacterium]
MADPHANQRPPLSLESLREKVNEGEIDTVLMVFPDTNGRLVGKRLTAHYFLDHATDAGTHGCNYLLTVNIEMDPLEGFELASWEQGFGDFGMKPDLSTLRLLPWQRGAAMVLCDVQFDDGKLVAEAPRSVLRKQLDRLASAGLTCNIASELEFFLFNQTYHQVHESGYAKLIPSSDYRIDYHTMQTTRDEPIMHALRQQMGMAGIPIESTKGEWGKGQHEVNFVYAAPLAMADGHMVFKQGAKEIAEQHGKALSFMPKILASEAGNSCHIHISIARGGENLFWDKGANQPSKYFRQFLGGQMKHSRELCYFFAPTINAYKRFQPGSWAPTRMAWAMDNRTTGFRVVGHGDSFRIENRMPGGDANPYLAFAAMIGAGLAGVEEGLDCGEPYKGNAYVDAKLEALPTSLKDAAELLERSELARRAFGDDVVNFYAHTARQEVNAFDAAVTDWERVRYFERI